MIVLMLAIVAAAGFLVSTYLADTALGRSRLFHHLSMVIAAGVLLGVTLADLVPETFEMLSGGAAALWISSGFLGLFLIEQFTSGHTHHHEPHDHHPHAHGHEHRHAPALAADVPDDECVPTHPVLPFLIGLGLHNFVDGIVIGASHEVSDTAVSGVAVGMLFHQLPVGLSFAAVLLASGMLRGTMRLNAAIVAALIPLGAIVVLALPELSSDALGALIGIAAGAILYIATGHLLPEAHSEQRRPGIAAAFVVALVGTVLFVNFLHDNTDVHDHGHDEHGEVEGHSESAHHDEEDHEEAHAE